MKTTIKVTRRLIKLAREEAIHNKKNGLFPFHGTCCPIAQALKKMRVRFRTVTSYRIALNGNPTDFLPLPDKAVKFIDRFDRSRKAVPFQFTLDVPGKFLPRQKKQ